MDRRTLLFGGAALTLAAGGGLAVLLSGTEEKGTPAKDAPKGPSARDVLFDRKRPDAERREAFVRALETQYAELTFGEGTVGQFVEEHLKHRPLPKDERRYNREVYRLLMSTDLFVGTTDTTRTLKFVAYYDPYVNPCYNPLVRRG